MHLLDFFPHKSKHEQRNSQPSITHIAFLSAYTTTQTSSSLTNCLIFKYTKSKYYTIIEMGILYCNKIGSSAFSSLAIVVVVVIVIALSTTNASCYLVGAFQPVNNSPSSLSLSTRTIPGIKTESQHSITNIIEIEKRKYVATTYSTTTTTNTILFMAPVNNKKKKNVNVNVNDDEGNDDNANTGISPFLENIKNAKPGTLIILPFVALFGIDLLLNIAVITKRSIDYFVFGQAPITEPWW